MTVRQDLEINQGSTWSRVYTHATDLTGYSAEMSIKTTFSAGLQATPTLVIAGSTVTMSLTNVQTSAMDSGVFVYDLELTSEAGDVERALQGSVYVHPEVTGSTGVVIGESFNDDFNNDFW